MKFFIDSANINEIKEALKWGIVDGVTTNPTLLAKNSEDLTVIETIKEICKIVDGPVSAEVLATSTDGIIQEGKQFAKIDENIVVKVPLTEDGIKAVCKFTSEGIKTNVTLCFSVTQALIAAKAGATFISPFIGRLDDIATDGTHLIEDIVKIYQNYGFETQVLAASIRSPLHMRKMALIGANVATIPFSVFSSLIKHPLTDIGLAQFLEDGKKLSIS